jgi:hypothetical protein
MKSWVTVVLFTLIARIATPVLASSQFNDISEIESLLPPLQGWAGKSESLMVAADDPWVTPAERSGLTETPSYAETTAWLRKMVSAAPELEMVSIGRSLQGRDFWMVIASADRAFTAQALEASGKPLLLAHSGIHSGEIDGKEGPISSSYPF